MLDPEYLAVIGTVGSALILKFSEKVVGFNKIKPTKTTIVQIDDVNEPEMCDYFEIRQTQQKMVDAGIIKPTEVSVCDNPECENCAGTRKAIEAAKPITMKTPDGKPMERFRKVRGFNVPVPMGVPDRAEAHWERSETTNSYNIFWSWFDTFSGEKMGLKSLFVDVPDASWKSVHDPNTKEYLGDYRFGKFGQTELRNPENSETVIRNGQCNCEIHVFADGSRKPKVCKQCRSKSRPKALPTSGYDKSYNQAPAIGTEVVYR